MSNLPLLIEKLITLYNDDKNGLPFLSAITKHATDFGKDVDAFSKTLIDPAGRSLAISIPTPFTIILPPNLIIPKTPESVAVNSVAAIYASAFTAYVATFQLSTSPIPSHPSIVTPPGIVTFQKVTDNGVGPSIKTDFTRIFREQNVGVVPPAAQVLTATKIANAISKAFLTKLSCLISGVDSTPITPIPFSISGNFI